MKCYFPNQPRFEKMTKNLNIQSTTDVVIIGGGVIGCAIAYHLRKSGIDVIVVDQGEIGAEASSAAAGLLAQLGSISGPGPFADLLLSSFALFPALVLEIEEAIGIRIDFDQPTSFPLVLNSI